MATTPYALGNTINDSGQMLNVVEKNELFIMKNLNTEGACTSSAIPQTLTIKQAEALKKIHITGETMNGKPVVEMPMRILNMKSAFEEKLLCTGITMTAGSACAFSCPFCYVDNLFARQPGMLAAKAHLGLTHEQMVIRRQDAVEKLKSELLTPKRKKPKAICHEEHVIYSSPTVDCAANVTLAKETLEMCMVVLDYTVWEIRLLSKSPLLAWIADRIPEKYRQRMIYGFSTGVLDDQFGKYETGTALVSRRLRALHRLQDEGMRTYGMICPIPPQRDYATFVADMAEAIRIDRCEHVWAEVINARGASMRRTCQRFEELGFQWESAMLKKLAGDQELWESHAQAAFEAIHAVTPADKLRFLQYVNPAHLNWWKQHKKHGAILLGKGADES